MTNQDSWGAGARGFGQQQDPATPGYPQQQGYPQAGVYGYPPQPGYGAYGGATQPSAKSKVAAAVLAFFLGWLGAHNFYLGKTGTAVTQLVLAIIGWVLYFVGVGIIASAGAAYSYSYDPDMVMVGGIVSGAAWLLFLAPVGIWAFVEFIMILAGARSYSTDRQGLPLR